MFPRYGGDAQQSESLDRGIGWE